MPFIDPLILDGVKDVLRAVSSDCPLEELEGVLLQAACKVAGTPSGVFFRVLPLDGNLPGLEATAQFGVPEQPEDRRIQFPADASTAAGRATLSASAEPVPELTRIPHPLVPQGARCEYCFPIVTAGELVGIIDLFSIERGAFTKDVMQALEALAGLLGPASEIHSKWEQQRQLRHEILEYDTHASFGKLLSAIAHEVSDPLASIFGSASLLELEIPDREHTASISIIREESAKASGLLRKLMAFSKLEVRAPEMIDFRELVRNVVDITRPLLKSQGSKISVTLPDTECPMSVDRIAIGQAIFALITHSDGAGRKLKVVLERGKARVTLDIFDSLARLSDPEECALTDQLTIGCISGSFPAIRLSAARSAFNKNGGELKVLEEIDAPAHFQLKLPLANTEVAPAVEAPSELPLAEKSHVLIVDDEPAVRDMLGNLFRRHHCDVVIARDGEEALVLAQAEVFDVVVTDVRMPRLSGTDFYRRLVDGYGGDFAGKFIFITGDMDSINDHDGINELGGSHHVIQKPFQPAELLRLAEVALPS